MKLFVNLNISSLRMRDVTLNLCRESLSINCPSLSITVHYVRAQISLYIPQILSNRPLLQLNQNTLRNMQNKIQLSSK